MGFTEIGYPLPGEPPAVYEKWFFDRLGYLPSVSDIEQYKRLSAVNLRVLPILETVVGNLPDISITEDLSTFRPMRELNFILPRRN